jgi:hypothetical protein
MNKNGSPNIKNLRKPAKIKNIRQLNRLIDSYFDTCAAGRLYNWIDKKGLPITSSLIIPPSFEGLALHLGFQSRVSLWDYSNKNNGHELYSVAITRAKSKIAKINLEMAKLNLINERVVLFDLQVNHGYVPEMNINISEQHQLSDQDRLLLQAVIRQLPGQLRQLPQDTTQGCVEGEVV